MPYIETVYPAESTNFGEFTKIFVHGVGGLSAQVYSQEIQNHSGDSTKSVFDDHGRPVWIKDENGYITHRPYDQATGALKTLITDVDTGITPDEPAGWTTPAGGGLHLTTAYELDALGRPTKIASHGNRI